MIGAFVLYQILRPKVEAQVYAYQKKRALAEAMRPERVAVLEVERRRVREEQQRAHILAAEEAARKKREAALKADEEGKSKSPRLPGFALGGVGRPGSSGGASSGPRWGADRMKPRGG